MTCLTSPLPAAAARPPVLTLNLSPSQTAQILRELAHAGNPSAAADLEYASWMPDPGAIELASWDARLRSPRQ